MANWRYMLMHAFVFSIFVYGCSAIEPPEDNPKVEALTPSSKIKATATGYWYQHLVFTHSPYLGNPDSTLEILASIGVLPTEVWATTGETCIRNGDTISPVYTFILRTEKDHGHYIHHKEDSWSPMMSKVNPEDEWAFQFEPCDSGRWVMHYRFQVSKIGF